MELRKKEIYVSLLHRHDITGSRKRHSIEVLQKFLCLAGISSTLSVRRNSEFERQPLYLESLALRFQSSCQRQKHKHDT